MSEYVDKKWAECVRAMEALASAVAVRKYYMGVVDRETAMKVNAAFIREASDRLDKAEAAFLQAKAENHCGNRYEQGSNRPLGYCSFRAMHEGWHSFEGGEP